MMSMKERRRLAVLGQVASGHLSVVGAGRLLGLSERQVRRVWKRYREEGDAGLVHRLRGRPGNRSREPAVRDRAVALYGERYADFGCTLACEYLAERHGLVVDAETLRRWLTSAGLWSRRRRSPRKRRRRLRRACFGELVQIDGSHHDWFEGRRASCVLMVMVDDATSWTWAWFFESETTQAAMTVFKQWALKHGVPSALYPDRDSIYRVNTKGADEMAARTGRRPLTQFGRAMVSLGVALTCAKSPQAKGRVERMNGVLQDRLVKALRVAGIDDIETANRYLRARFLPALNRRFAIEPVDSTDVHTPVSARDLAGVLVERDFRRVGRDQCVSWRGQVLQLTPKRGRPSLAGKQVAVHRTLAGEVQVVWRDRVVPHTPLAQRPPRPKPGPSVAARLAEHKPPTKPPPDHPWRRQGEGGSAPARASPSPPLLPPRPAA